MCSDPGLELGAADLRNPTDFGMATADSAGSSSARKLNPGILRRHRCSVARGQVHCQEFDFRLIKRRTVSPLNFDTLVAAALSRPWPSPIIAAENEHDLGRIEILVFDAAQEIAALGRSANAQGVRRVSLPDVFVAAKELERVPRYIWRRPSRRCCRSRCRIRCW
jgi:hypothetical protein